MTTAQPSPAPASLPSQPPELSISIIDVSDSINTNARMRAEEKLKDMMKADRLSVRSLARRAFLSMTEEFQRQRLIARERSSIEEEAFDNTDGKVMCDNESFAVVDRFQSGLSDLIHEKRIVLNNDESNKDDNERRILEEFRKALRDYLNSKLSSTGAPTQPTATSSMQTGKFEKMWHRIKESRLGGRIVKCFNQIRPVPDASDSLEQKITQLSMRIGKIRKIGKLDSSALGGDCESAVDALFDDIQSDRITLADALEKIDKTEIVIGKSKCIEGRGAKTVTERIIEHTGRIPLLNTILTPVIVGAGVSIGVWFAARAWGMLARVAGTVAGGAIAGGGIAAFKKYGQMTSEYQNQMQRAALGYGLTGSESAIEKSIADSIHYMLPACQITTAIDNMLAAVNSPDFCAYDGSALTDEMETALNVSEYTQLLFDLSFENKRDFISWGDSASVETTKLTILTRLATLNQRLQEIEDSVPGADHATFVGMCKQARDKTREEWSALRMQELRDKQNAFNRIRLEETRKAFLQGVVMGGGIGALMGVVGHIIHPSPSIAAIHDTHHSAPPAQGLTGSPSPAPDVEQHLSPGPQHVDENMPLQAGHHVNADQYLDQLESKGARVEEISRVCHYNNNTAEPDANELRVYLGGANHTGLTEAGDLELDVSHMKTGGSRAGSLVPNIENLRDGGHLKALVTLDGNHQGQVIAFDVDAETGKVVIPKDHAAAEAIFGSPDKAGENVEIRARFIEIAEEVTDNSGKPKFDADGDKLYRILATNVGKGNTSYIIHDTAPAAVLPPVSTDAAPSIQPSSYIPSEVESLEQASFSRASLSSLADDAGLALSSPNRTTTLYEPFAGHLIAPYVGLPRFYFASTWLQDWYMWWLYGQQYYGRPV